MPSQGPLAMTFFDLAKMKAAFAEGSFQVGTENDQGSGKLDVRSPRGGPGMKEWATRAGRAYNAHVFYPTASNCTR